MKETPKEKKQRHGEDASFYEVEKVASMNECTGLMPFLPQDEAEDAHYAHLLSIHRAKPESGDE
ncbi:MAG: hypothetical protein RSJ41_04325 [Clostridia bacterium]